MTEGVYQGDGSRGTLLYILKLHFGEECIYFFGALGVAGFVFFEVAFAADDAVLQVEDAVAATGRADVMGYHDYALTELLAGGGSVDFGQSIEHSYAVGGV